MPSPTPSHCPGFALSRSRVASSRRQWSRGNWWRVDVAAAIRGNTRAESRNAAPDPVSERMTSATKAKGLVMDRAPRTGGQLIALTDAERQARVRLAACYRIFDHLGWTEQIFNHIT